MQYHCNSTSLQTVPSQVIPSQPAQAPQIQLLMPAPQPVCIVQERENTPPPVAEKEPPIHPFAGIPESNYVPPSVHNFAAPADKNGSKDKEPAYKTFAPVQNPKVADVIYEARYASLSCTVYLSNILWIPLASIWASCLIMRLPLQ